MNKGILWAGIVIIILIGGWYWYSTNSSSSTMFAGDAGTYEYQCDTGTRFSMTPSTDVAAIRLTPGAGAAFAEADLAFVNADAGQRFEGAGMVFVGAGEGVTFSEGGRTHVCEPVPSTEMAPWNWGDAGEGGGVQQDVSLIVSENIQGVWRDSTDPKGTREFKSDFTAVDTYEGEVVSTGFWVAFTKMNAPEISFPLEENTVYVQLTMSGTQADTLTFKLVKLTPDELELVYMDRGGVLTYEKVR